MGSGRAASDDQATVDVIDELGALRPDAQRVSEDDERRRLAELPAHERLALVMTQVRFHQAVQARTLTAEQRARLRSRQVAAARRRWGDAVP